MTAFDPASRALAHSLVDLLFDHVEGIEERPVVDWKPSSALSERVRLDQPAAEPLELARLVAEESIQLHHPAYMGHQVCPPFAEGARAAAIMGIPGRNVLKVPTDDAYRMDVGALEEVLAAAEERDDASVLAIVATSGSTATGAFDRLDEIALLRDRYRTWLHVDAAHGASALLSEALAPLVRDLDRADSFSWDPHKMLWMRPSCAASGCSA